MASLKGCSCDPSTGGPCAGAYPVCCDKKEGLGCWGSSANCKCAPSTGNPCFGSYSVCCTKSPDSGPLCYIDNKGCL